MAQVLEVKGREQAGVWAEAAAGRKGAVAKGEEAVLRQVLADIAFAPNVARKQPINLGALVMNKNAPSAEPL